MRRALALLLAALPPAATAAPVPSSPAPGSAAAQLGADAYTRYELLAPETGKFRILYTVTADDPGATAYYNPIRKGSRASDERVTDLATGKPLAFEIVGGAAARAGGMADADVDGEYVKVTLARPVPPGGEGRILIDKTYEDRKSYFQDGSTIVFDRSLGNKRNAVVLPRGYELVSSNTPVQVLQEADGRIALSFWETSAAPTPLRIVARPAAGLRPGGLAALAPRLPERARQTREVVYYFQPPETHAFDLYHDYTETRPGVRTYVNLVRAGSTVTNPDAVNLDTGARLDHRVVRGRAAVLAVEPDATDLSDESEAVVFSFPPVPPGGSARLRFSETYTDPARYRLEGDELVWDRSFGRAANAIVLPAGWALTNSAMPAIASRLPDGRIRLDFLNPRPDELGVLVTARRVGAR